MGKTKRTESKSKGHALPAELNDLLSAHPVAGHLFDQLSSSCQREYIEWVAGAKKEETRKKRARETIAMILRKQRG